MVSKITCALVAIFMLAPAPAGASFPSMEMPTLEAWKLYDLGVTDVDGDGRLDPFTINHKFDASLLRRTGTGWVDVYDRLGLSPTPAFPGFESVRSAPSLSSPGVYLYASIRAEPGDPLHLRSVGRSASGSISLLARRIQIEHVDRATATISPASGDRRMIEFEIEPGGSIDLSVDHHDQPLGVSIDAPLPAEEIRVGADAVPASSRDFALRLRDRHGYGFADFDGNGSRDLLISSGGLGGEILDPFYAGRQSDELLLSRHGRMVEGTARSGLVKGSCRGRGVDIADFDGDGNLDVLISCEAGLPLVALGSGDGTFTPVPGPPVPGDELRLLDVVGDPRPEILSVGGSAAQVWRYEDSGWQATQEMTLLNHAGRVAHIALADINSDGRLDALALSMRGNTLLLNGRGRLLRRPPDGKWRLPTRGSVAGAFVDHDNDGDLDLHLLPQGLFERKEKRFRRTGKLTYPPLPGGPLRSGTVSWADLDGDGRRDLLSSRGVGEFSHEQVLDRRRNATRGGSWLQLDLIGAPGNSEAIGARVRVRADAHNQFAWVGQADDSAHSSGHYRVYFGLGEAQRASRVAIRWPDGTRTVRKGVRGNRLLRVAHPAAG